MKVKITILTGMAIALLSFTLTSKNAGHSKNSAKKNTQETRVNRGLAMDDKNQFN